MNDMKCDDYIKDKWIVEVNSYECKQIVSPINLAIEDVSKIDIYLLVLLII